MPSARAARWIGPPPPRRRRRPETPRRRPQRQPVLAEHGRQAHPRLARQPPALDLEAAGPRARPAGGVDQHRQAAPLQQHLLGARLRARGPRPHAERPRRYVVLDHRVRAAADLLDTAVVRAVAALGTGVARNPGPAGFGSPCRKRTRRASNVGSVVETISSTRWPGTALHRPT